MGGGGVSIHPTPKPGGTIKSSSGSHPDFAPDEQMFQTNSQFLQKMIVYCVNNARLSSFSLGFHFFLIFNFIFPTLYN